MAKNSGIALRASHRQHKRGVIFSFDALLAAVVLGLFVASLAFLSSRSAENDLGKLLSKKQSTDLLLAMDKSGTLAKMDFQQANLTLQSALPQDTNYLIELEYYNYSGPGGSFTLVNSTMQSRGNASAASELDSSQRNFAVVRAPQPPLYGLARLSLWKD